MRQPYMPSMSFEVKTKVAIGHNSQQYVADVIVSLTHGVIALDSLGFEINYLVNPWSHSTG